MTHRDPPPTCVCCKEQFSRCRGCCYACYQRHAYQVRHGKTTWKKLEAAGKATPPNGGPTKRQIFRF